MTLRVDPRIVESLNAELKVQRDRIQLYAKGSQQRNDAEAHLRQLEDQYKRVTAGLMGVAQ